MVDRGSFAATAAKEIQEEIGLEIPEDELINLSELAIPACPEGEEQSPRAIFLSCGGCDEYIPIFLHEKRILREQLKEWTGKLTGLRSEGEKVCEHALFRFHSLVKFRYIQSYGRSYGSGLNLRESKSYERGIK